LNVHAPTEEKSNDIKASLYKELECIFKQFPKYHMKIPFIDFNAKVGKKDIFKPTTGNETLHETGSIMGLEQ
jgi:hypothetical protein